MVIDYSERRQVNRNRPRRQFPWGIVIGNLVVLVIGYAAGFGTGWFLRAPASHVPAPAAVSAKEGRPAASPAPGQTVQASPKPADPPLTFYETLPKGSKQVIIGTGLNPAKTESVQKKESMSVPSGGVPPQAGTTQPNPGSEKPAPAQQVGPSVQSPATKASVPAEKGKDASKPKFTVQLASCKTKDEADALKAKFAGVGINTYILESTVAGKGTWYRVRAGHKITRKEADDIAAKVGGQAMVLLD